MSFDPFHSDHDPRAAPTPALAIRLSCERVVLHDHLMCALWWSGVNPTKSPLPHFGSSGYRDLLGRPPDLHFSKGNAVEVEMDVGNKQKMEEAWREAGQITPRKRLLVHPLTEHRDSSDV